MKNPTEHPIEKREADPDRLAVEAHVHRAKAVSALDDKAREQLAPATQLELSQHQLDVEENPRAKK